MNRFQLQSHERRQRRFSRGDGVTVTEGPHKGRQGTVTGFGHDAGPEGRSKLGYIIRFLDDVGGLVTLPSEQLESAPALNSGKYGGPSRGGEPGGWFNHRLTKYRALRVRR